MKTAADFLLAKTGHVLVREGAISATRPFRIERLRLPESVTSTWQAPLRFQVDLDRVTTPCGFSYREGGWHPYRATLQELLAAPELPYEQTTLSRFYEQFRPATVQAAILDGETEQLEPITRWPAVMPLFKHFWALTPRRVQEVLSAPEDVKRSGQQFGPQPIEYGARQVERLHEAHRSIQAQGYRPEAFVDGALKGYFLVRGDDYRFVVLEGYHRLAAFEALGIRRPLARLHRAHPPVVDGEDLARWVSGPRAIFPQTTAERLFDALFDESGLAKASRLGLI